MNRLLSAVTAAFTLLLSAAVAHGQTEACAADVNGDGVVGGIDLATVLTRWGGNFGSTARFARSSERQNFTLAPLTNYYTGFRAARNP